MANRSRYSKELFARITEGYRQAGAGNHARAASFAGCDRKTARRAWTTGWPAYVWAPPIEKTLAEEGDEARVRAAARARAEEAAQDALAARQREESIKSMGEEMAIRTAGRAAVIDMCKAVFARRDLLGDLLDRLQEEAPRLKARDLAAAIREVRQLLSGLPELARTITQTGQSVRAEHATSGAAAPPLDTNDGAIEEAFTVGLEQLLNGLSRGHLWSTPFRFVPDDHFCDLVRRLAVAVGVIDAEVPSPQLGAFEEEEAPAPQAAPPTSRDAAAGALVCAWPSGGNPRSAPIPASVQLAAAQVLEEDEPEEFSIGAGTAHVVAQPDAWQPDPDEGGGPGGRDQKWPPRPARRS